MLIEREQSLQSLNEAMIQARAAHGSIAYVTGEAGVGKTSLLRVFSIGLGDSAPVFWGSCEALFTARPLGPLYDIANAISPDFFALLDENTAQNALFSAFLRCIEARNGVSIIVFEDVHWADTATLDLIKYLGRRITHLNVLLILTARSDEVGVDHPLSQVVGDLPAQSMRRVELKPLSKEAVLGLSKKAGRSGGELYRITGGNPFFLTELLAGDTADKLPHSVRDAVWSRISRLDVEERRALEILSIVPGSLEPWLVPEILGDESDKLTESCLDLGLVVFDENANFRFRHELARLATLNRLNTAQQKALHGRICDAMIRTAEAGHPIHISRLVHHAEGAADFERVLELAPKAARQAARMGAHQQAAAHLQTALRHADHAPKEVVAQLNEDWAYEAGIAIGINRDIIDARNRAIDLWRALKNPQKVALNLRWLSRLHWYQGKSVLAGDYIDQALEVLEGLPPGPELAMAYSARSQLHMLYDRMEEAIEWGERAIRLAEETGEMEARIHSLNNVGSALLLSGRAGGEEKMEESLALALEHGFHEQAARAYTNYAEYAVVFKKFEKAERILAEGIAFDTRHDLDSWTYYLVGRKAQLRLEQGRLREAETIAEGVLGLDRLTLVMKLPARTVLGKTKLRLGHSGGREILEEALEDALSTGEPQNITPVRLGLAEYHWLSGNLKAASAQLEQLTTMDYHAFDPWELGEMAVWARRCGFDMPGSLESLALSKPHCAELNGDPGSAAKQWIDLGVPYEAGLALLQSEGSEAGANLAKAVSILDPIEARPASDLARERAANFGIKSKIPKRRRGPYRASRQHPLGLSKREQEVFKLIAEGLNNGEIAEYLNRSQRTVEHHVSSLLGKMNATNRIDVVLRLRNEPWLLPVRDAGRLTAPEN